MADNEVNTDGGTVVGGNVSVGGDFTGRDNYETNTTNISGNNVGRDEYNTKTTTISGNLIVAITALLIVGIIASMAIIRSIRLIPVEPPEPKADQAINSLTTTITATEKPTESIEPISPMICPTPPIYAESVNFDEVMIEIRSREFVMGRSKPGFSSPQHKVTVETFQIDKYEVTNRQYQKFVIEENHSPPESWTGSEFPISQAFFPVAGVTWDDAKAYCAWVGKRLVREDEWELACQYMQGQQPLQENISSSNMANTVEISCNGPIMVGSFVNPDDEIVADLIGNVNEWTHSVWRDYPYNRDDGREDENNTQEKRVIRGGSYDITMLSCTNRLFALPEIASVDTGFRCSK